MKRFIVYAFPLVLPVVLCVIGCGFLDDTPNFLAASPPPGSTIFSDSTLTLSFDGAPEDVTVSVGTATPSGNTVIVKGPFSSGALSLVVGWGGGLGSDADLQC